jgi:hypothetical protein
VIKSNWAFKTASWFLLLLGTLHTVFDQFNRWLNKGEIAQSTVFSEMKTYQINLFGPHTLYEFYSGFSLAMGILLIGYGALNLCVIKHIEPSKVYKLTIPNMLVCLFMLFTSIIYFHLLATGMIIISLIGYIVSFKLGRSAL